MRKLIQICFTVFILLPTFGYCGAITIGAAPLGDEKKVASRIIKNNFPICKNVTSAQRLPDNSINAKCDKVQYRVFTIFNSETGKLSEVALNCKAAKELLKVSC